MTDSAKQSNSTGSRTRRWTIATAFFAVFVFASAFSIAAAQIALGLSLLMFLASSGWRVWLTFPLPVKRVLTAAGLYIGWLGISSLVNDRPLESLDTMREEWLFLIIPLGVALMTRPGRREFFSNVLAAAILLLSIFAVAQHFTGAYWFSDHGLHTARGSYRLAGFFSHPLTFGNYLAAATLFLAGLMVHLWRELPPRRHLLYLAAVAVGLAAMVLCNSRGPMAAVVVGLVALGLTLRRAWYAVAGALIILLLFAVISPNVAGRFGELLRKDLRTDNPAGRVFIWSTSLDLIGDNPVFGVGPGNFSEEYALRLPTDAPPRDRMGHAHSDFLNIAAVAGLPGLLLYLVVWVVVLRSLWRAWCNKDIPLAARRLSLAAIIGSVTFLASSLTEAVFADEEVRELLMFIWAAGLSAWATLPDRRTES